jgi:hypothetical protein
VDALPEPPATDDVGTPACGTEEVDGAEGVDGVLTFGTDGVLTCGTEGADGTEGVGTDGTCGTGTDAFGV